jgi:hypothetical protein
MFITEDLIRALGRCKESKPFLVACKIEEMRNKSTQDLKGGGVGAYTLTRTLK